MLPNPERRKGGAPLLGAAGPGGVGPYGPYGADDLEDDQDDGQEPGDLDPVGAVNNRVAQLVADARARRARRQEQRQEQQTARDAGLAARHAAKLRRLEDGLQGDGNQTPRTET